jgi:hypothetical protein
MTRKTLINMYVTAVVTGVAALALSSNANAWSIKKPLALAIQIIVVIRSPIDAWLMDGKYSKAVTVIRALAVLMVLWLASPARGAEVTSDGPYKWGGGSIVINGDLVDGDFEKFRKVATSFTDYEKVLVLLNSTGGAAVALDIGDLIRKSGMSTSVAEKDECLSVCAFIWLAGKHRFSGRTSRIGFHGVYNMRTDEVDHDAAMFDAIIGAYLGHLGFSYGDILWMLEPPPLNLHWLNAELAKEHNIYFQWFDEAFLDNKKSPPPAPPPVAAHTKSEISLSCPNNSSTVTVELGLTQTDDGPHIGYFDVEHHLPSGVFKRSEQYKKDNYSLARNNTWWQWRGKLMRDTTTWMIGQLTALDNSNFTYKEWVYNGPPGTVGLSNGVLQTNVICRRST